MPIKVTCSCENWRESAHQIFHAQVQYTLATGVNYTGKGFRFCPWCGRLLAPVAGDVVCTFDHDMLALQGHTTCPECGHIPPHP